MRNFSFDTVICMIAAMAISAIISAALCMTISQNENTSSGSTKTTASAYEQVYVESNGGEDVGDAEETDQSYNTDDGEYVADEGDSEVQENESDQTIGTISTKSVFIREECTSKSQAVDVAFRNESVVVLDSSGRWFHVEHNGKYGYIYGAFISLDNQVSD